MSKHVSFTAVFEGENLNYGEGFGNIQSLKKISNKGKVFSYISRQALRYDIVRLMNEESDMPLTPVGADGKVIQFEKDARIDRYPEIDLFGYMKTGKNSGNNSQEIRKAAVRLTDAVSLEAYNNDIDFGNNMGIASRSKDADNGLFQSEIHKSFYSYTVTIDLDRIGVDENGAMEISADEKIKRLNAFYDAVKMLYRDIKGKRENLSPCFIIGGLYDSGNPFFYNRVNLEFHKDRVSINNEILNDVLKTEINGKEIKDSTMTGFVKGMFENAESVDAANKFSVEEFFKNLKQKTADCFKG